MADGEMASSGGGVVRVEGPNVKLNCGGGAGEALLVALSWASLAAGVSGDPRAVAPAEAPDSPLETLGRAGREGAVVCDLEVGPQRGEAPEAVEARQGAVLVKSVLVGPLVWLRRCRPFILDLT